jgi:polyhydroxyalkanoate synthesis regulator phasin
MQEERKRILDMVENGTITAQEALALLEELGKQTAPVTPFVPEEKEYKSHRIIIRISSRT